MAMIKPDGVFGNYTDKIKEVILESGFSIITEMVVRLDEGNATVFYAEHSHRDFFPGLVKYMTSGPVYIMVLEKVNAISDWRALVGPTDARKARISHPASQMETQVEPWREQKINHKIRSYSINSGEKAVHGNLNLPYSSNRESFLKKH
ncbi:hypothetical protein QJS10_CPB12g01810 [Acorus calamus]|uniref:Nucleoside diphosphate kinase-like domain-containing protein n=1 Tax=Acorus calamus TaxID=4465 RepID=A0AAV9DP93_ACOCL|nr:hypothetical protein QJS10_CPB12g01810 [Acorus calamus]